LVGCNLVGRGRLWSVTGNRKKSGFRFGFGSNRHETENETENKTENETENTKKTIYKTEPEAKTEKRTFFENKFFKFGKSIIYVILFNKFYYFHTKNLLWQSNLHFSWLKFRLKVLKK
jgi:hypothetical protein